MDNKHDRLTTHPNKAIPDETIFLESDQVSDKNIK